MSNIADLKELSSSVDFWGTTTGFNSDRLCEILAFAVNSVEQLEAAERERDELRAEQAEHDEQIARMESKFSMAKRALDSKTARCEKAEAELRRRDAAAGEAVHFYRELNPYNGMKTDWIEVDSEQLAMLRESTDPNTAEFRSLYTDAPPAVLPPERLSLNNGVVGFNEGYNECLADARALGAQQQKPVQLPNGCGERYAWSDGVHNLLCDIKSELDAANVKWEAKK